MALDQQSLGALAHSSSGEAWQTIIQHVLAIASKPLSAAGAPNEVVRRDREIGDLDLFLSSAGWDLWRDFSDSVERTSDRLVKWWPQPYAAKAVLILDALSLRELPWLLQGAAEHGFTVHTAIATASELPGETNAFARALGFASRSQLQSNGASGTHKLRTPGQPTHTESVDLPWKDCEALVDPTPNQVFWHQWPDAQLHDSAGAGQGLEPLTRHIAERLTDPAFWQFVERLATGRRLVITSDHGYAATGYFHDADGEAAKFLKDTFASSRYRKGTDDVGPFAPPVALQVSNSHGDWLLVSGRRKWRSQGGYPTLTHGGLSLLEVLSPWVEVSR